MSIIQVEVVSNEEHIYSGEASFVVVPTQSGELGIYPKHTPVMSLLRPGVLRLTIPDQQEEQLLAISGGLLEVQPNKIMILAEVAVRSEELDKQRSEEARKVAEESLKSASDDKSVAQAQASLAAAIAELKAIEYIKNRKN